MGHSFFRYITANNLEDLITSIADAKHQGLGLDPAVDSETDRYFVESVLDGYFLEYVRNTVNCHRTLDYVPWRDVKYIAFVEVDIKAIALEDRNAPVYGSATVKLKGDRVNPSHITGNVYIATVK